MTDITFLPATALAKMIRAKEISSEEVLRHYLTRVDRFNDDLNAVVVDIREGALQEARAADTQLARSNQVGPLHGVPITVKESYQVAGTPSTWGDPALQDNVATEDADAIKRLKQAGAVLFGKTNLPLAAADLQSYNEVYGTTNNPYDHARVPGGSSGGSAAALAAGLTGMEAGSDIGGSIRGPAHFCGVFGHKPTHNLVWPRGHAAKLGLRAAPDLTVVGPFGRSASDLNVALQCMAGPNEILSRGYQLRLPPPPERGLAGLRVAVWSDDELCPVSRETVRRVELVAQACADAGAQVDYQSRPDFDAAQSHRAYNHLLQAEMASRQSDENYASIVAYLASVDPEKANPRTLATLSAQVSSFRDWKAQHEFREQLRWKWHDFFSGYDVLLMPVTPTPAFPHDHGKFGERTITVDDRQMPYFEQIFWAGLASMSYLPVSVVPTGLDDDGLPIGIQVVGPEYGDLVTIGVAAELEAIGFSFTPPPNYQ